MSRPYLNRWQSLAIITAVMLVVVGGAVVLVVRLDSQIAEEARVRMSDFVRRQATDVDRVFDAAIQDIRLARRNVVFEDDALGTDGELSAGSRTDIESAIKYMGDRYSVDEICLIRNDGREMARYNNAQIASVDVLSPDESMANPAFGPTVALPDDVVHITDPYVSPDSERWVYGVATPIFLRDGQRAGLLHFEIPVVAATEHLQRGFAADSFSFMIQKGGAELLYHPEMTALRAEAGIVDAPDAPFPAASMLGGESWKTALDYMTGMGRGSTSFVQDGRRYRVDFYDANKAADIVGTAVPEDVLYADVSRARTDLAITLGPLVALLLTVSAWFGSRLRRAHLRLEESNRESAQLAGIVRAADDAIVRTDLDGLIVTWNRGAEQMYGYTEDEALGHPLAALVSKDRRAEIDQLLGTVAHGEAVQHHETVHGHRDGRRIDVTITLSPIRDETGVVTAASVVASDITVRKQLEQELSHQALHDSLTGMPNRALFRDRLAHALETAQRTEGEKRQQVAVLFLDVDEFKVINDSLGHPTGDELLRGIAGRLAMAIRPGDTCSRLGGDEFTVLLEDVGDLKNAERAARRLLRRFESPFDLGGHRVVVSVSVGIALSGDSTDPDEILRRADLAMYEAKGRGKARYAVFDQSMEDRAWQRMQLESELRTAIAERQLHVHYQPIFDLSDGAMHSVEALVRWQHPRRGWVLPSDFIPTAEQTGLILPIGSFVLGTALRQMQAWSKTGFGKDLLMSVNVSPRQLRETDFVDQLSVLLAETAINPSHLQLEITESLLHEDEAAVATVTRVRALNVHVALDDFGTGYSSLGSLRRLPIDSIKIDKSFISGTQDREHGDAIVTAAVGFAAAAGLKVTAEGIETSEQLAALQKLGCRYGQGFFLSEVLPADEVTQLLRSPNKNAFTDASYVDKSAAANEAEKSTTRNKAGWTPAQASS